LYTAAGAWRVGSLDILDPVRAVEEGNGTVVGLPMFSLRVRRLAGDGMRSNGRHAGPDKVGGI